ncbi:hypothetical protein BDQ12DRAFT_671536 [Crucibulum laeve]|uniref:Uncharacterized protein n=1 Tax=Crucibulum laeve TaxID=68775 RepID=A0A5C3LFC6_9AGAR|nr:hypothetical protein BDQ12DRAFT_671536 [Crucibulum laeve]
MISTVTTHEKWVSYFRDHLKTLFTAIHLIVALGIPLLYSISFNLRPDPSQWSGQREQSFAVDPDIELAPVRSNFDDGITVDVAIIEAFKVKIEIITSHWQMIQFGSGVLIAAALTIPQLQTSYPDTQSLGLSSFFSALCGLAALLFTFIYLSNKELLVNPTTIVQWSQSPLGYAVDSRHLVLMSPFFSRYGIYQLLLQTLSQTRAAVPLQQ